MKYLFYLLIIPTICVADIMKLEDVSISYRKFFSNSVDPIIINQSISLPFSNTYIFSLRLPQIRHLNEINFNLKESLFTYGYYRGNIDIYSIKVDWMDSNEYSIPSISNTFGFEYGPFNIEYTKSFYPVNNYILNNFAPVDDSIMFRFIFGGKKNDR